MRSLTPLLLSLAAATPGAAQVAFKPYADPALRAGDTLRVGHEGRFTLSVARGRKRLPSTEVRWTVRADLEVDGVGGAGEISAARLSLQGIGGYQRKRKDQCLSIESGNKLVYVEPARAKGLVVVFGRQASGAYTWGPAKGDGSSLIAQASAHRTQPVAREKGRGKHAGLADTLDLLVLYCDRWARFLAVPGARNLFAPPSGQFSLGDRWAMPPASPGVLLGPGFTLDPAPSEVKLSSGAASVGAKEPQSVGITLRGVARAASIPSGTALDMAYVRTSLRLTKVPTAFAGQAFRGEPAKATYEAALSFARDHRARGARVDHDLVGVVPYGKASLRVRWEGRETYVLTRP